MYAVPCVAADLSVAKEVILLGADIFSLVDNPEVRTHYYCTKTIEGDIVCAASIRIELCGSLGTIIQVRGLFGCRKYAT